MRDFLITFAVLFVAMCAPIPAAVIGGLMFAYGGAKL